jgi:hypothetical protein
LRRFIGPGARIGLYVWLAGGAPLQAAAGSETNLLGFGFTGPESFPIESGIHQLRAADLDGDGLNDLVVANNARSKITLLYNQTGRTNQTREARPPVKLELNELPPDARFRIDSIASEKRIATLVVADLNADPRPDLAYYGEPKELVVQYNQGSNAWSAPKRWPIDDGQLSPNALGSGDLNGDGRADLVLLGENTLYLLAQQADHSLAEPEKIPYSGAVKSVQVLDIDGDGRDDLLLVNWESANPFRFRLQNSAGQLGPEVHFNLPPIRSYIAEDLDGDHKTEVITIAMSSGRAQVWSFARKAAETLAGSFRQGQFQVLPLTRTTRAKRGITWGDVNGDSRPDLLVAEPDTGQLTLFLQQKDGGLSQARSFSTLTGVSELAVAGGGASQPADIYLLSPDERQVGVSRFDKQGRLPFPTIVPMEGKPLTMAVGALRKRGSKSALAVVLDQDGKRTLYVREADGSATIQKLSETFKSNPATMVMHDVNQDGLADLVILIPYEKIKVLLQVEGREFEEVDVSPPGGTVEQPWLSLADVDADGREELLLAQKNFLRAVVLKAETGSDGGTNKTWALIVRDQINGASSQSRIVGAAPLREGTNALPALFLLDAERKALTLCERDTNGVWQVVRNVSLPFAEFTELRPLALGGKSPNSIALQGLNAVAWMSLGGEVWDLRELDDYETPIKDGQLRDVVAGDLNQDGRKDLVFLETAKNHLDVVIFDKDRKLVPATRWRVFEQRTYRGRQGEQPEPREALIMDVTGDRKNDLILLVHDRVLVYPQE